MLRLILAVLLLVPSVTFGATIFIDSNLGTNCTAGTYSITNRNCTGSDGNAYNNIAAALTASAANDTVYFRSGSYSINTAGTDGITVKNGQTWGTYPGDTARSATVTAATGRRRVFIIYGGSGAQNGIVRDLTIVGGECWGVHVASTNGAKVINNEIRGWNDQAVNESGCAGVGITAYDAQDTENGEVTDNYIHSPVLAASENAAVHVGGSGSFTVSNLLIARNRVEGTRYGIWMDVVACDPITHGATPCRIEENYVKQPVRYCFLAEIGGTGHYQRNICDTPGILGIFLNTRDADLSGAKIQNNTFYLCPDTCIWFSGAGDPTGTITDVLIDNNIMYSTNNNASHSLLNVGNAYLSETTTRYRNNSFHAVNTNNGICWGDLDVADTTALCNLGSATVYAASSAGISSWQAAAPNGVASGNIAGDPLFANPAGEDFRLCTAAGVPHASCPGASPAINAGINVGLSYNGTAPDIGALESDSITSPPPADNLVSDTTISNPDTTISNPDTTISNPDLKKPRGRGRK